MGENRNTLGAVEWDLDCFPHAVLSAETVADKG